MSGTTRSFWRVRRREVTARHTWWPPIASTFVLALALTACVAPAPPTDAALAQGIRYLQAQYNPAVGLLRESPQTQPHRYWLATDNLLALYALRCVGAPAPTAAIQATYHRFGAPRHGLSEILDRQPIAWPPRTPVQTRVVAYGPEEVWLEQRVGDAYMADWAQYADLALVYALRLHQAGDRAAAQRAYRTASHLYDGVGFADAAYQTDGMYATYKLALAVYTAHTLGQPVPADILAALLAKQAQPGASCGAEPCAGGFYTLYDATGMVRGDTNTETTAYAVRALCAMER